jgi:hypothetical protein
MLVSAILKSKSDDGVVTLPSHTPLLQVAELLSSRRIGAVVICDDGKTLLASCRNVMWCANWAAGGRTVWLRRQPRS